MKNGAVRIRLCVQQFNNRNKGKAGPDELSAPTLPVAAARYAVSRSASSSSFPRALRRRLMAIDFENAFLNGWMKRDVCIRLPPEDGDRAYATGEWSFISALGHNVMFPLRNGVTGVRWAKRKMPSLFVNTANICFWWCSRTRKKRETPPKTTKHRQSFVHFCSLVREHTDMWCSRGGGVREHAKNGGGFREHKFH